MKNEETLADLVDLAHVIESHCGCPRIEVDAQTWSIVASRLGSSRWTLSGLWGDADTVHMAILDQDVSDFAIVTLRCPDGQFPSVAQFHPAALHLERTVQDLFGLVAQNCPDGRAWLDHGRWNLSHPLGRKEPNELPSPFYDFLPAEGQSLHQLAVGPVHAGIIEPGHFHFNVNGEVIVRLEVRLGYAHKGVEHLMRGSPIEHGAKLSGRVSGDSTVAYGIAFARATEAALQVEIPAKAHWLRALMAELERLSNHIGDIGAICNDASFSLMQAHCAILRERILRACDYCFGHRLMRDCVLLGGVAYDLSFEQRSALYALTAELRRRLPTLVKLYDTTSSLQDRTVGTGILSPALAAQYGAGGFVGRASGRAFDARQSRQYPPYDELRFDVPVLHEGDVNARVWIRIREIEESLSLVEQILRGLPRGRCQTTVEPHAAEGLAVVEGFRGDVLVWIRLNEDGLIERCHLRDPSWFQWPLLEAAIEGNIVADFPICNKSFNCSYSGHDL